MQTLLLLLLFATAHICIGQCSDGYYMVNQYNNMCLKTLDQIATIKASPCRTSNPRSWISKNIRKTRELKFTGYI